MHILATAKHRGSTQVLYPVIKELIKRDHDVRVVATGTKEEAKGFEDLSFTHSEKPEYMDFLRGFDLLLTGQSGCQTADGYFVSAANQLGIPSVSVGDGNANYKARLGDELPTILAMMDENCRGAIKEELGKEAAERVRVVGWTAFDNYAKLRQDFSAAKKRDLLMKLEINPFSDLDVFFSQNIHPDATYLQTDTHPRSFWQDNFDYEMSITEAVFVAASDLRRTLVVKPHPGEKHVKNYTEELTKKFGFTYLPADACDTVQLMLAANSMTAGRSTCLTQACLLDKNCAGILPERGLDWVAVSPALGLDAIPYTKIWEEIPAMMKYVTGSGDMLAHDRKRFSVDGKASARLVDLIEEII
jgi:hypothetical protein